MKIHEKLDYRLASAYSAYGALLRVMHRHGVPTIGADKEFATAFLQQIIKLLESERQCERSGCRELMHDGSKWMDQFENAEPKILQTIYQAAGDRE